MSSDESVLSRLMTVIEQRKSASPDSSYTARLLHGGVAKISAKVMEEAAEVCEAAGESGEAGRQHTIHEAADLIYHLWVLVAARDIGIGDIEQELSRRFGISGLEEKASRPQRESKENPK